MFIIEILNLASHRYIHEWIGHSPPISTAYGMELKKILIGLTKNVVSNSALTKALEQFHLKITRLNGSEGVGMGNAVRNH